jgi:uncharacterized membrane protein
LPGAQVGNVIGSIDAHEAKGDAMSTIEESVEVDVPLRTAYDQWTQFEEFPRFMEGVDEVRQLDDTRLHWRASIAGVTREWDAKITQQVPDEVIAWQATEGHLNDGAVRFEPLDDAHTRITLLMEHEAEGFVESVGDALGVVKRRAKGDLKRFKEMVESEGDATGQWRGEVHQGETTSGAGLRDDEGVPTPTADRDDPTLGLPNYAREEDVNMGQGLDPDRGSTFDKALERDADVSQQRYESDAPTPETRDAMEDHPPRTD